MDAAYTWEVDAEMSFRQGILSRAMGSVLLTLFCLVQAVWSWTNIAPGVRIRVDLITALFSLILSFILGWIAFKSSFRADRILIGTISVVCALAALRAAPLTPTAMLVAYVAKPYLWSFSTLVGLAVLLQCFGRSPREIPLSKLYPLSALPNCVGSAW
jgi:hypothetical protein